MKDAMLERDLVAAKRHPHKSRGKVAHKTRRTGHIRGERNAQERTLKERTHIRAHKLEHVNLDIIVVTDDGKLVIVLWIFHSITICPPLAPDKGHCCCRCWGSEWLRWLGSW